MDMVEDAPAAPSVETPDDAPDVPRAETPGVDDLNKQIADNLMAQAEAAKRIRRQNMISWKANVDIRLGVRPAAVYTGGVAIDDLGEDGRSTINPDWSLTKTKTANLYSQVPTVQLTHDNKAYAAAISPFAKALNYELSEKRANVGVAMEEILNDVVNAAGVGAILVSYVARFENVKMPLEEQIQTPSGVLPTATLTMDQLTRLEKAGLVHLKDSPRTVSDKFCCTRKSPADLITPRQFVGSNFDDADWVGYSGRMAWADALNDLKLKLSDKSRVLGNETKTQDTLRRDNNDQETITLVEMVSYDEIFYWRHRMDPDCKSLQSIWRLVFVHGIGEAVIHEQWTGQQFNDPQAPGKYIGCSKFPLRFLTLTYITDNPIPPSDSQAGRPQVNDMRRSRSQMFQNRERSIPIRWFDVNRIDPTLQDTLMRGVVQGMIPTNGDGSRSVGEIARASYPAEDMAFDRQVKQDLMESWQIGENQQGGQAGGKHTAAEADIVQQNFSTRIGQERGRVASCFTSIAETMAGLMILFSDFPNLSDQEKQAMSQAWDDKSVVQDIVFTIRPDSTVLLDSGARIKKLTDFLNITVKSGYINPEPIIREIAELSGIDPAEVMIQPAPPRPDEPNISYRFTGKDDMMNAMVVAMLLHSGQGPTAEEIAQAKQLLQDAAQLPAPPGAPGAPGAPGPAGAVPPGAGGPPGAGQPPASIPPGGAPGVNGNPDAHPHFQIASKVAKRSQDMST